MAVRQKNTLTAQSFSCTHRQKMGEKKLINSPFKKDSAEVNQSNRSSSFIQDEHFHLAPTTHVSQLKLHVYPLKIQPYQIGTAPRLERAERVKHIRLGPVGSLQWVFSRSHLKPTRFILLGKMGYNPPIKKAKRDRLDDVLCHAILSHVNIVLHSFHFFFPGKFTKNLSIVLSCLIAGIWK